MPPVFTFGSVGMLISIVSVVTIVGKVGTPIIIHPSTRLRFFRLRLFKLYYRCHLCWVVRWRYRW